MNQEGIIVRRQTNLNNRPTSKNQRIETHCISYSSYKLIQVIRQIFMASKTMSSVTEIIPLAIAGHFTVGNNNINTM